MRRIVKILLIVAIIFVAVLIIRDLVPEAKAAIDNAVGPQVTGFFGAIAAGIEPIHTTFLAPWPNHAFFWGFIGMGFMFTLLWAYDFLRLKAKQSIDHKAGIMGTKKEPIVTETTPLPTPTKTKDDTEEET